MPWLLEMEDAECFEDATDEEEYASVGKISEQKYLIKENALLQAIKTNECPQAPAVANINVNFGSTRNNHDGVLQPVKPFNCQSPVDNLREVDVDISDYTQKHDVHEKFLILAVQKLQERMNESTRSGVRKEKSPMVSAVYENREFLATLDEGSEINCVDEGFAVSNGIKYIPSSCKAMAAGSSSMKLAGQTLFNIDIDVLGARSNVRWSLGKMVVVTNLGVDVLIGEPGKFDNKIITIPHHKIIEAIDVDNNTVKLPYYPKIIMHNIDYIPCRARTTQIIYQGQKLKYELPPELKNESYVNISPRRNTSTIWFACRNLKVASDGSVDIENITEHPVEVLRHEHFADIRSCTEVVQEDLLNGAFVSKIYDLGCEDISHLVPHKQTDNVDSFLSEISIDPDNQLNEEWKKRFQNICEEYSDIINPRPGKYNGYFGRVDNSINFSAIPPPTIRAHLPK